MPRENAVVNRRDVRVNTSLSEGKPRNDAQFVSRLSLADAIRRRTSGSRDDRLARKSDNNQHSTCPLRTPFRYKRSLLSAKKRRVHGFAGKACAIGSALDALCLSSPSLFSDFTQCVGRRKTRRRNALTWGISDSGEGPPFYIERAQQRGPVLFPIQTNAAARIAGSRFCCFFAARKCLRNLASLGRCFCSGE
jgi:hypothetical protein